MPAHNAYHVDGREFDFDRGADRSIFGVDVEILDENVLRIDGSREIFHVTFYGSGTDLPKRSVSTWLLIECWCRRYLSRPNVCYSFHKLVKIAGSQFIRQEASELILYVEKVRRIRRGKLIRFVCFNEYRETIVSGLREREQENAESFKQSSQETIHLVTEVGRRIRIVFESRNATE